MFKNEAILSILIDVMCIKKLKITLKYYRPDSFVLRHTSDTLVFNFTGALWKFNKKARVYVGMDNTTNVTVCVIREYTV